MKPIGRNQRMKAILAAYEAKQHAEPISAFQVLRNLVVYLRMVMGA